MNQFGNSLHATKTYSQLREVARNMPPVQSCMKAADFESTSVNVGALGYYYRFSHINQSALGLMQTLCQEQAVLERYDAILSGEIMNPSEYRPVTHHNYRRKIVSGGDAEYKELCDFVDVVRSGQLRPRSGRPFRHVAWVGIGGSHLGPSAIISALRAAGHTFGALDVTFFSNLDPAHCYSLLDRLDWDSTLFVFASKSGNTSEVMTLMTLIQQYAAEMGWNDGYLETHSVVITSAGTPLDQPGRFLRSFTIEPGIGGRFSFSSSVGALIVGLCFGSDVYKSVLKGAVRMDENAKEASLWDNASLMAACVGVWHSTFMAYRVASIVPYLPGLTDFAHHLQQLHCESNGKQISLTGTALPYPTCPVIVPGTGTNAQHAYFQLLHQSDTVVPVEFIGVNQTSFSSMSTRFKRVQDSLINQKELQTRNILAQMQALFSGDPKNGFPGNRPSTLVWLSEFTAESIGCLLGFYENLIMFQGALWHINSFDQPGVELGKKMAESNASVDTMLASLFKQNYGV
ncbi:MAG: hypothetical protein O3A01_08275 [bacterium]|nr:hypothetical protein [bacterium]